eukprot:PRCOL_00003832-RA
MSTVARGLVGDMKIHRAVNNGDLDAIVKAVEDGADVNEVRARADRRRLSNVIAALIQAGNTPLHNAAYEGKIEVAQVLLQMGADVNALNNAGDRPWHWANNMDNEAMMAFLEKNGANKDQGRVLLQDHVPKTKDFYENYPEHPPPHPEYLEWREEEDRKYEQEKHKLIPGM